MSTDRAKAFTALVEWDAEAGVWFVSETDFPGLVAEAPTVEEITAKIRERLPELYALNRHLIADADCEDLPIHIMAKRLEHVRAA